EQVVSASDSPYGQQPSSLFFALRTALRAGLNEDQLRDMLGRNASRLADREPLPEPTRPVGDSTFAMPLQLARIHSYLAMAMPFLWLRQADTMGALGLALNACAERNRAPETTERIEVLLARAAELWKWLPEVEDEDERAKGYRTMQRLLHIADVEALTCA